MNSFQSARLSIRQSISKVKEFKFEGVTESTCYNRKEGTIVGQIECSWKTIDKEDYTLKEVDVWRHCKWVTYSYPNTIIFEVHYTDGVEFYVMERDQKGSSSCYINTY